MVFYLDLIEIEAIIYNEKSFGAEYEFVDIPSDMIEKAEKARSHLVEECASHDENLLEKYLAEEEISVEEIKNAIRKGCIEIHSCYVWVLHLKIKVYRDCWIV